MTKNKKKELEQMQQEMHTEMAKLVTDIMMIGLREAYGGPVMVAAILNAFIEMIKVSMKANDKDIVMNMLTAMGKDLDAIGISTEFSFKPIPKMEVVDE